MTITHYTSSAAPQRRFFYLPQFLCLVALSASTATMHASAIGYGQNATGGSGGQTVTATNLAEYKQAVSSSAPLIIQISGTISGIGNSVNVAPNKTITGIGANPTISGDIRLFPSNNVIVQNLNITSDNTSAGSGGEDGITIKNGAHNIWVDHCTFTDCADGSLDVTLQSDNVTISWCKFQYTHDHSHNFVNLIGASDSDPDTGKLHVTVHHNWWATLCKERMPRVRFGQVHVYNNYYGAAGSNYDIGVGNDAQILVENNYFDNQSLTWKNYSSSGHQGLIHWNSGNLFVNTSIPTWAPNSNVFAPPYSYGLDSGSSVKAIVMAGAGAGAGGSVALNQPPSVSITSPTNGSTVGAGANITINATAADSDGTVSKVEFFQGSTLLGTASAAPYSFIWNNVPPGSYSLTARATDNGGATTTSAAVSVTVSGRVATVYQSENGTSSAGSTVDTNHAGFTGTGFVNTPNVIDSFSEVTVNVATAGSYLIDFRFANGAAANRPANLSVNGTVVQTDVSFPITGAWTTWSDVSVTQTLQAGVNKIRLTATTAGGCANFDKVTVQ